MVNVILLDAQSRNSLCMQKWIQVGLFNLTPTFYSLSCKNIFLVFASNSLHGILVKGLGNTINSTGQKSEGKKGTELVTKDRKEISWKVQCLHELRETWEGKEEMTSTYCIIKVGCR